MPQKQETLTYWVRTHSRELYAWALGKTSDPGLAEDLVQDTFLAAAEKWAHFEGRSEARTWLFSILKNKIADHYRQQARQAVRRIPADETESFFDEEGRWRKGAEPRAWEEAAANLLDQPEFVGMLDGCMEGLPEQMRACLQMTYLQGKKGREVCQELGISTTNYWQVMSRARLRLRECLEKYWFKP